MEGGEQLGTHTARFGEIEQRGVALTPRGRVLYDEALARTRAAVSVGASGEGAGIYMDELAAQFSSLPDDLDALRREGLAFFSYRAVAPDAPIDRAENLEALVACGALVADPQTYEDFLPVSAAGIFQSNLGSDAEERCRLGQPFGFRGGARGGVVDEMMFMPGPKRKPSVR